MFQIRFFVRRLTEEEPADDSRVARQFIFHIKPSEMDAHPSVWWWTHEERFRSSASSSHVGGDRGKWRRNQYFLSKKQNVSLSPLFKKKIKKKKIVDSFPVAMRCFRRWWNQCSSPGSCLTWLFALYSSTRITWWQDMLIAEFETGQCKKNLIWAFSETLWSRPLLFHPERRQTLPAMLAVPTALVVETLHKQEMTPVS